MVTRASRNALLLGVLGVLALSSCVPAQEETSSLSLDRIFTDREFGVEEPPSVKWLADDSGYLVAERTTPGDDRGFRDLVLYDARTGDREVVLPETRLVPPGRSSPLIVEDFSWSPDRSVFLLSVRSNAGTGEREFWTWSEGSGGLRRLAESERDASISAAELSPTGDRIAFVAENDLFVTELSSGRTLRLTNDGTETRVNATSRGVYAGLSAAGFRWSPDGRRIAYSQFDMEGVNHFRIINYTDSLYPSVRSIPYVKPGETLPAVRAGVVPATGGRTTWLEVPGDPRMNYLRHLTWSPDSGELLITQLARRQNRARVFRADATTGSLSLLLTETDDAWLDLHAPRWMRGGEYFTWVSERDGWRRVYRAATEDGRLDVLTPGVFDILSVEGIDEEGGWLYFIAAPDDPTRRYLHRVPLDPGGSPERITPDAETGTHHYELSPGTNWAWRTFSTFDTPPVTDLVSLPEHEVVRVAVDNAALGRKLADLDRGETEFFRIDVGDGVELDGWMMRPPDFDAARRYPVLFYVYGMPAAQSVLDAWPSRDPATDRLSNRRLWHWMMTQRGYVIMCVDNRGTPAPRGRDFRKIIYLRHGVLPAQDQAAAVRAIADRWSWVDPSRIGIYGWSGGGNVSMNAILRHPDVYSLAMPAAGLYHHKYYHASFTERFLGLPQENPEAYEATAPVSVAGNLRGSLLLIHPTGDPNVHFQSAEAMVNKLIAAKKQFTFMPYPNRTHYMPEGESTTYHLYDLYTRFLERNMPSTPGR